MRLVSAPIPQPGPLKKPAVQNAVATGVGAAVTAAVASTGVGAPLAGAAGGAAAGATRARLAGGDLKQVARSAAIGGATGAVGGAVSSNLSSAISPTQAAAWSGAASGAASGGIGSALSGKKPSQILRSAAIGGASGAASGATASAVGRGMEVDPQKFGVNTAFTQAVSGAVGGVTSARLSGQTKGLGRAAAQGAQSGAIGSAVSAAGSVGGTALADEMGWSKQPSQPLRDDDAETEEETQEEQSSYRSRPYILKRESLLGEGNAPHSPALQPASGRFLDPGTGARPAAEARIQDYQRQRARDEGESDALQLGAARPVDPDSGHRHAPEALADREAERRLHAKATDGMRALGAAPDMGEGRGPRAIVPPMDADSAPKTISEIQRRNPVPAPRAPAAEADPDGGVVVGPTNQPKPRGAGFQAYLDAAEAGSARQRAAGVERHLAALRDQYGDVAGTAPDAEQPKPVELVALVKARAASDRGSFNSYLSSRSAAALVGAHRDPYRAEAFAENALWNALDIVNGEANAAESARNLVLEMDRRDPAAAKRFAELVLERLPTPADRA
ncbi:MAG: hypothetical protein FJX46_03430, partial [Alphaproteobacteria bacterium]|nr:hypothetical protein [Alphaproteobacteria bacterium]